VHVERIGCPADAGARRLADRILPLDVGGYLVPLRHDLQRDVGDVARDLFRDRLAFRVVGIQDPRLSPAFQRRGELPGEIRGVGDAGIHPVAAQRNPQVRGVAADEDAPLPEPVRDEAARDPVLRCEHFDLKVGPDAEDHADRPITIHGGEVRLSVIGIVLDVPGLVAVHRHCHPAATGVERKIEPRRLSREQAFQRGRAYIGRVRVLQHRCPLKLGADRLAHHRARAVAADEILALDRDLLSAVEVARNRRDALLVLGEPVDFGAVEDANTRLRCHMGKQHRLEKYLITAVRVLRCRP